MTLRVSKAMLPKLLLGILGLIFFLIGSLLDFPCTSFVAFYVLLLSIFAVWWSKDNCLFLILFSLLAYSNYSIAFSEYIVVKANTLFTKYAGTPEAALGIYIMLLFWSVITIALPTRIPPFSANKYINYWRVEFAKQVCWMNGEHSVRLP